MIIVKDFRVYYKNFYWKSQPKRWPWVYESNGNKGVGVNFDGEL